MLRDVVAVGLHAGLGGQHQPAVGQRLELVGLGHQRCRAAGSCRRPAALSNLRNTSSNELPWSLAVSTDLVLAGVEARPPCPHGLLDRAADAAVPEGHLDRPVGLGQCLDAGTRAGWPPRRPRPPGRRRLRPWSAARCTPAHEHRGRAARRAATRCRIALIPSPPRRSGPG